MDKTDEQAYRAEISRIAKVSICTIDRFRPSGDVDAAFDVVMNACNDSEWMNRQEDIICISGPRTFAKAKMEYDVATAAFPEEAIVDPTARKRHFALSVLSMDVLAEMTAITARDQKNGMFAGRHRSR